jgi:hypothetical protein
MIDYKPAISGETGKRMPKKAAQKAYPTLKARA